MATAIAPFVTLVNTAMAATALTSSLDTTMTAIQGNTSMNKPDELAGLPEDVREAFRVFERYECDYPDTNRLDLVLRDYCLRLLRENADLRSRCNVFAQSTARFRGDKERAEAELAALKRKIAEATVGTLELCYNGHEPSFIGFNKPFKRGATPELGRDYALLPVGGE